MYKTSQIFKRGFLAQSKCTTRVPLSDQHPRKSLTALGEKGGAVGSAQPPPHHHPGTFLQFHCWRKVSGGSFPVGARPAHRFSQVGLSRQQRPQEDTVPQGQGARGPWPPMVSTGWTRVPHAGRPAGRAATSSAWSLLHPREARANLIQARNLLHLLTY